MNAGGVRLVFAFAATLAAGCVMRPVQVGAARTFPSPTPDAAPGGGAGLYRITKVSELSRFTGPIDLSSVSMVGGDRYLAASDSDGLLAELELGIDRMTGRLTGFRCVRTTRLAGAVDAEGAAYDPLTGHVWIADEADVSIREYDLSGIRRRELEIPPVFRKSRPNLSFEALALSADGLTLWTCNEEALACDGERSTRGRGSFVRLARFVRASAANSWRPAGQWVYRTGKVKGGPFRGVTASGVSDLALLPDGTLLVLEREMSKTLLPRFRCRIDQVDFTGATDVSELDSLAGADWTPVRKTRIYEEMTGRANYEGICVGPTLAGGSVILVLVSDGDGPATEDVMTLRLDR